MSSPFSKGETRSRADLALLAVVTLLVVLAVLQHRWLGTIAEAERRGLKEEAEAKAAAISRDIDRELTRAFLELRIDGRLFREAKLQGPVDGALFADQYARFRQESPHSGLVKAVYVADRRGDTPSRLLRFEPETKAFVPEEWPAVLTPVREAIDYDVAAALPIPVPLPNLLPPVMADVPALLSPVMDIIVSDQRALPPDARGASSRVSQMLMRHTGRGPVEIVLLDPDYLRGALVTRVAEAQLPEDGAFAWAVVKNGGEPVLGGTGARGAPDASAPLLRLRFDDLDKSLLRGVLPGLAGLVSESSVRFVVQLNGSSQTRASTETTIASGSPTRWTTSARSSGGPAPWALELRHRAGSIDAAVRGQQTRNALLSASILGVLGLSAGLVFVSARRLRATATQQVEFVASVSHELRTPLSVIRSAADNLADGVVEGREQAMRYGALIRGESIRLADMVEHVLEFAGADSAGRAARGPVDVIEAARAAVAAMAGLASERGARVEVEAPADPVRVNGDASHLTRAIANLIGNALKYGGESPRVTVRVTRRDKGVEIAVADDGQGLDGAEIPRLFEPFYRGHRASEAQVPGSGLGLALVKRIVESHGGAVTAANGASGGALFTIALPAA